MYSKKKNAIQNLIDQLQLIKGTNTSELHTNLLATFYDCITKKHELKKDEQAYKADIRALRVNGLVTRDAEGNISISTDLPYYDKLVQSNKTY